MTVSEGDLGSVVEHVDHARYVKWLDLAAERHADSLGLTRAALKAEGLMWFVARHEIDYLAESWLNDDLSIYTWVRDIARVRSWRDSLIYRPLDSSIICRATTLWVMVDLATRRPARIPSHWVDSLRCAAASV